MKAYIARLKCCGSALPFPLPSRRVWQPIHQLMSHFIVELCSCMLSIVERIPPVFVGFLQERTRQVHSTVGSTMVDSRAHPSSTPNNPNPSSSNNSNMVTSLTPPTGPAVGTNPTTSNNSTTNHKARPHPPPRLQE